MACASHARLASLVVLRIELPLSVSLMFTCRPSVGSALRSTMPISSKTAMAVPIDCGFTPSARASSEVVVGPSFSRRTRTDFCVQERSCDSEGAAARMRRIKSPNASPRSSTAVSLLFRDGIHREYILREAVCKDELYSLSVYLWG